jgi:hypothetical protein
MVKRVGITLVVIALLSLGAGMLANFGGAATASNVPRQQSTVAANAQRTHSASVIRATPSVAASRTKPASPPTMALSQSTRQASSTSSSGIALTRGTGRGSAMPGGITRHSVPATTTRTAVLSALQGSHVLTTTTPLTSTGTTAVTTTVQIVDPGKVQLPQPGPLLLLNPNTAALGGTIDVIGTGFDGGKLVTLTLVLPSKQGSMVLDTAQASRSGDFSKNVTLPSSLPSYSFKVVADERKGYAHAEAPGTIAIGSPRATLSTNVGKPGDIVYTTASGFTANELVDVFLNNLATTPVTSLQAGADGKLLLAPVPVPYGPPGPTSLLLLGRQSHGLAAIPFELLSLYPNGSVSSYSAVADTVLHFSASGFGPDEYVDVHVNMPDSVIVGRLQADSSGNIRSGGSFRIPFSLKKQNTFVLTGEQSHTSATITFTVQPYTPLAVPSTYDGSPGTAFTFYGSGFARNETVRVYLNGSQVATMSTDNLGNLVAKPGLYLIGSNTQPGKLRFILAGDKSVTQVPVTVNVAAPAGPVQLGAANATGGN